MIEQDAAEDSPMLAYCQRGMLDVVSQAALERQNLSCTYRAHCELESVLITIIVIIAITIIVLIIFYYLLV